MEVRNELNIFILLYEVFTLLESKDFHSPQFDQLNKNSLWKVRIPFSHLTKLCEVVAVFFCRCEMCRFQAGYEKYVIEVRSREITRRPGYML